MRARYRHKRTHDRRREIVEAALACFGEAGVEATTIGDVRARATASTGSIYHHFRDKDGLAAEVYRHVLREYHSSLLAELPSWRSARSLVRGIVRHLIAWVDTNRDAARFLVEMRHSDAVLPFDASIRDDTSEFVAAISAALARHVRAGALRALPMRVYAAVIIGPALALVAGWVRDGMRDDLKTDAEALADAAWNAVTAHRRTEDVRRCETIEHGMDSRPRAKPAHAGRGGAAAPGDRGRSARRSR
jgi:AcrR family transcriptional regulator